MFKNFILISKIFFFNITNIYTYNVLKKCANVVHENIYLYEVIKWLRYIVVLKFSLIIW